MKTQTLHRPSSNMKSPARLKVFNWALIGAFLLVPLMGLAEVQAQELFVTSQGTHEILRYDSTTGAFIDAFVPSGSGGLFVPNDVVLGPDGNLYVASLATSQVLRYDGETGAFLDVFVTAGSGGLIAPQDMVFGPAGNLYISSGTRQVLRYHGTTGAFIDVFVTAGSGGLNTNKGLEFGPDGHLYVGSLAPPLGPDGPEFDPDGNEIPRPDRVLRYDGLTGAFRDEFVADVDLGHPSDLAFGPDGHLYVSGLRADGGDVRRYDGTTGAFLDVFVEAGSGGLDDPIGFVFRTPSTTCASEVTTIPGLMAEVDALTTSVETVDALNHTLTHVETFVDKEKFTTARKRVENFIGQVVTRSNYDESNVNRILLDEANSLICSGANVLIGLPLE